MTRRPATAAAAVLLLAAALAGCGSGDDGASTSAASATSAATATLPASATTAKPGDDKARFTEAQVVRLAGLTPIEGGRAWRSQTGCRVTKIFRTRSEVIANRTAFASLVVTNPTDDVGVKFDPVAGCREALTANLTLVR